MAINIKELNVTLHIGESAADKATNDEVNTKSNVTADGCSGVFDHNAVVQDTVKEVMRILKEKNER